MKSKTNAEVKSPFPTACVKRRYKRTVVSFFFLKKGGGVEYIQGWKCDLVHKIVYWKSDLVSKILDLLFNVSHLISVSHPCLQDSGGGGHKGLSPSAD